jgi:hypothetical protein
VILVGNMVTSTKGSKTEAQEPQDCPFSIEELPGHKCLRYPESLIRSMYVYARPYLNHFSGNLFKHFSKYGLIWP